MVRRVMSWTYEMRTLIHLIRGQASLSLQDGTAIFNHIFASELRASGYADGLDVERFRDEYNFRDKDGRSAMWKRICAATIDEPEKRDRVVLNDRIRDAATALGLDINGMPASAEPRGNTGYSAQPYAPVDDADEETMTMPISPTSTSAKMRKSSTAFAEDPERPSRAYEEEEAARSYTVNHDGIDPIVAQTLEQRPGGRNHPLPKAKQTENRKRTVSSRQSFGKQVLQNKEGRQTFQAQGQTTAGNNKQQAAEHIHQARAVVASSPPDPFSDTAARRPSAAITVGHLKMSDSTAKHPPSHRDVEIRDSVMGDAPAVTDKKLRAAPGVLAETYKKPQPSSGAPTQSIADAQTTTSTSSGMPASTLEMIHYSEAEWDRSTPHATSGDFIKHTDEVYLIGGNVYSAKIDGQEQLVRVCQHLRCAKCKLGIKVGINGTVQQGGTGEVPSMDARELRALPGYRFEFGPDGKGFGDLDFYPGQRPGQGLTPQQQFIQLADARGIEWDDAELFMKPEPRSRTGS